MKKAQAALAATIANRNETQTLEQAHLTGGSAQRAVSPAVPAQDPLSKDEKSALRKFEGVIEHGLKVFVQVGEALTEIRDARLYRESHPTFETYCRERWNFSKTHANRLIQSAAVAKNLAPIGVKPANESQVRILASFAPVEQVKVFKNALKVAEGKPERVTAKVIADAAQKLGLRVAAPQGTSSAGNVSGGPRADVVARKAVVEAISDWAEDEWENVSRLSVADFIKAIKGVVAKI